MKNFVLILVLVTLNGCAVQQMSGGPSNPSSPSSSGGMPSPSTPSSSGSSSPPTSGGTSMPSPSTPSSSGSSSPPTSGGISMPSPSLPSGSQSSESGSQSSESGSQSSESGSQSSESGSSSSTSGSESVGDNQSSESTGSGSSNQSPDSESGSGVMSSDLGTGQSAASIFDESLGDFDKEMAGERVVIAAANQGTGAMTGQEIADLESIMEAELDGPVELGSDTEASTINQSNESDDGESQEEITEEELKRTPSCIEASGFGEDKIARQLRVFALKEDDPSIRAELWKQYLLHMGKTESQIKECIDDIK
ncbi:MAG: hypothetical protein MK218_03910 [Gammaproteobacteria bacterium]|nr:hypothetical protein [Gammaproteobacteria bacterium]